jgi:hypothetical protein
MLRVTILAMALPVAFSLAGPIYYGYTDGPYSRVLIWAAACTVILMWTSRRSLVGSLINTPSSPAIKLVNAIAIVVAVGVSFIIGDSAVYCLVRLISN